MAKEDIHYHRNLPHYHPNGYPLFITFRLAGSLPLETLAELKSKREFELKALKNNTSDERYKIAKSILATMMIGSTSVSLVRADYRLIALLESSQKKCKI